MPPEQHSTTENPGAHVPPPADEPHDNNTAMAAIAYIGPLIILSYLLAKDNAFAKFHIKQALVLFVIEIAVYVLGMLVPFLWPILALINLAVFVLAIIGIVNAIKGKEALLPLVGKYASHFTF